MQISQLPEEIWNTPALLYQPHYHLAGPQGMVLVGPRSIAITDLAPYSSWMAFRSRILDVLTKCANATIYKGPIRLGLRYINAFDEDVLGDLTISVTSPYIGMSIDSTQITLTGKQEGFSTRLLVSNSMATEDRQQCVVDIDISKKFDGANLDLGVVLDQLDDAHQIEKKTFFALLSKNLLDSLAPEY
jgi:uncharacterized protein (TIGR04255 family)